MTYAQWQHWKHPKTGLWDGQCHRKGRVLFFSRQGYNRERDYLAAITATIGRIWVSTRIEWKDRVKSPRRRK